MIGRRLLIVMAIVGFAFAVTGAEPTSGLPSPLEPGRFALTVASGGLERVAHLQIPEGHKPDGKAPLVLLLHGAGGSGSGMLDKDGWAAKADKEGFVAVAPDGVPLRPGTPADFRTNPRLWNSGQLKARSPRAAIDDVAYVGQLLDELSKKVPFDADRTFCSGHSNGGAMTFRLAEQIPQRFRAIGTVAGLMTADVARFKKPLPTLFILGTQDPLMPLAGGEVKLPWGSRQNSPVADSLATWAAAMGCTTEPTILSDRDGLKRVEYRSKSGGPALSVIYIEGHGHHWPGGQRILPESVVGSITRKLDAADAIWEFFRAHDPSLSTR
ncbi:MAG TPA: alpha/beta hydrolase-fold protein [Pirellulales bacterium]|jgi:polyhydroxybutyrate depolymerase|nr:alpha/beta hydrolase-fold protein [Pirellulales bacterium]